jgi:prepilin-type N-terminal cleavage/methylation domain-containing protein
MKRGFTLLEVAVALAVLGVGLVTCLQIFNGSLRLQKRSSRQTVAVLHARTAMDALLFQRDIRNHVEDRPTAEGFNTHIEVRRADAVDGLNESELGFQNEAEMALRYLRVVVTWQDGLGSKSYALESLRVAPRDDDD